VADAYGSPARPLRAAKQKAVARIKGKARAEEIEEEMEDGGVDEEMDLEDGDGEVLVLSSDSEGEKGSSGNRKNRQGGANRRRSSRTTVKQVETPPSDADEESGGEEEEHEIEMDVRSNLRATGRNGKHGKVVKLRNGTKVDAAEEEEPELGEEDDEDEDMEADYEEEEEEQGESRLDFSSRFDFAWTDFQIYRYHRRRRSRPHQCDIKIFVAL
jgi:hypothetical protein